MVSPTTVVLLTLLAGVGSISWYYGGADRWRALTDGRFVYGVPWGTLVTVTLVVAFYLVAQFGITSWDDPLVYPFLSTSLFYPLGIITSGFAHGSPAHLVSNMTGTLAFGVVAEYAWGHYPPTRRDEDSLLAGDGGRLSDPLIRAFVVVPGAMLGVALLTAMFTMGPALGFSGAVFAIAGFAIVTRPLSGLVAVAASSALGTLYNALANPIIRGTIESGAPGPPAWAGIAFQAHMLGFVVGAILGVGLLWARRTDLSHVRVFSGTLVFGLALSLWLLVWPASQDVYVLYRGAGVAFVVILASLVAVAAAGSDRQVPQSLAILWLVLLALPLILLGLAFLAATVGVVTDVEGGGAVAFGIVLAVLALLAMGLPAMPAALGDRGGRLATIRGVGLLSLGTVAVLLVLPGLLYGSIVVNDTSVTDTGEVEVGDYVVTYGEDVSGGQQLLGLDLGNESLSNTTYDGLFVVSEQRALWTLGERKATLAYKGNSSLQVGGVGWRETIDVRRLGWDVTGNDSAYAVDLTVDGETTRSFTTDPVRADVRIDDHRIAVVPTEDDFEVRAISNGSTVGSAPIPGRNETTSLGPLEVLVEDEDDTTKLVVESDGSRVTVAEKETY